MTKDLKAGDHVEWDYAGNTVKGTVEKKITSETKIKGHVAKATKDEPQFLVKSDKTGAEAAHKPEELRKK
jgi:hypothetical protein